jgi:hypothetical protein
MERQYSEEQDRPTDIEEVCKSLIYTALRGNQVGEIGMVRGMSLRYEI